MISIFKEKSTSAVFGLIILALVVHAYFLVTPPAVVTQPSDGILYYPLHLLSGIPSIFLSLLYYLTILVQALRISYFTNEMRLYPKASFTAAASYILLTAMLPQWNHISAALLANGFIIWLLFRLAKLTNASQPKTLLYNIGIIGGLMALCYYPAAFVLPAAFFALSISRPLRINEWIVLILGIITPLYFWAGYLFLADQLPVLKSLIPYFSIQKNLKGNTLHSITAFGFMGLLVLTGFIGWRAGNNRMQIQMRKTWAVVFIVLLLSVPAIFLMSTAWPLALIAACVPAAVFAGNAFLYTPRLLSALLFWLCLAVIAYVNWVPFKF